MLGRNGLRVSVKTVQNDFHGFYEYILGLLLEILLGLRSSNKT